jgi:hypothetical protein
MALVTNGKRLQYYYECVIQFTQTHPLPTNKSTTKKGNLTLIVIPLRAGSAVRNLRTFYQVASMNLS